MGLRATSLGSHCPDFPGRGRSGTNAAPDSRKIRQAPRAAQQPVIHHFNSAVDSDQLSLPLWHVAALYLPPRIRPKIAKHLRPWP
jgi:hypothetical protein